MMTKDASIASSTFYYYNFFEYFFLERHNIKHKTFFSHNCIEEIRYKECISTANRNSNRKNVVKYIIFSTPLQYCLL